MVGHKVYHHCGRSYHRQPQEPRIPQGHARAEIAKVAMIEEKDRRRGENGEERERMENGSEKG